MLLQVACTFAPTWGSPASRGPYADDDGVVVGVAVVGVVVAGVVVGEVVLGGVVVGEVVVVEPVGFTLAAGAGAEAGELNGPQAARKTQPPRRTPIRRLFSPKLRIP
jgi:hypothetical protein